MGVCLDMALPGAEDLSSESEQEEGEIIDVDEYEDISSDEEFNLRQRIEELESRNLELEKIATISSNNNKQNDYDMSYIDLVDDDSPPTTCTHHRHRSSRHGKVERSTTSSRRRKDKSSRHDENHHAHGRSSKQEQKRRDRSAKKPATRPAKVSRSRTTNGHSVARPRLPPATLEVSSSSDDEVAYCLDRGELHAALKRDIPSPKVVDTSSLKRKLLGVQQSVADFIACKVDEEEEESDLSASIEIMELLETLSDQNLMTVSAAMPSALEEQELRLAVLKSAILKKHENRKKRKVNESRPYSPTDTDILLDNSEQLFVDTKSALVDNMMEISPAQSPEMPDKILLSVDMDIASDASTSPIYLHEPEEPTSCLNMTDQWIPLPSEVVPMNDIHSFSMFQHNSTLLAPPPPPEPAPFDAVDYNAMDIDPVSGVDDEEEEALRSLLLSDQQSKKRKILDVEPESNVKVDMAVDSDADDLRALVLESIRKKNDPQKTANTMITLKNAVARLNSKPKHTNLATNMVVRVTEPLSNRPTTGPIVRPSTPNPTPIRTLITIVPTEAKEIIPMATNRVPSTPNPTPIRTLITIDSTETKEIIPMATNKVAKRRLSDNLPIADKPPATSPTNQLVEVPVAIPPQPINQKRRSALRINPVFKPVRPVVIRLTAGGSSSSEVDTDEHEPSELASAPIGSSSNDRFYDPSSPASIAMDSPAYAPSSPNHVHEMGADTTEITDTNTPAQLPVASTTAFQQKLDEYLKSVRSKNSQPGSSAAATPKSPKSPITISLKPRTPATPLVVRHLPLSSQIEYRQLVQRMKLLEKQKLARDPSRQQRLKVNLNAAAKPFSPTIAAQSTATPASRPDSLVKQVLVKSANDVQNAKQQQIVSRPAVDVQPTKSVEPAPVEIVVKPTVCPVEEIAPTVIDLDKQRVALHETEAEMAKHSNAFLGELTTIHQLVQSAQIVRRKQFRMQRQRDQLRKQLLLVEKALTAEQDAINQIFPAITAGHASIRTNRQKWIILRDRCRALGTEVTGKEYSPPAHEARQIEQQMRSVLMETRKLKAMKRSDVIVATKDVAQTHKENAFPVGEADSVVDLQPKDEAIPDEAPHSAVNSKAKEDGNAADDVPKADEALLNETPRPSSDSPTSVESTESKPNPSAVQSFSEVLSTLPDPPPPPPSEQPAKSMVKYQSPLDVMQQTQSSADGPHFNPDAVLCPFELQGSCDDPECVYQHIGNAT